MENKIRENETYIDERKSKIDDKLVAYHREMLENFQHERLIHLIVTFCFIFLTVIFGGALAFLMCNVAASFWWELIPLMLIVLILFIVSIFYVKHYYFLENHIQKMYDISRELYEGNKGLKQKLMDVVESIAQNNKIR